jgi:hypothetical protein
MSNTSKETDNEKTRTGGPLESRDSSSPPPMPSPDVDRTGGPLESRDNSSPPPMPSPDVERTGGPLESRAG